MRSTSGRTLQRISLALFFFVVIGFVVIGAGIGAAQARELTLDQRVDCQRAVEEVYWRHRIWPAENPGNKPSLSEVVSEAALRAKVENSLRQSMALEIWGKAITTSDLQSEMDRIARASHRPAMLNEIVDALHGDHWLVAECLVRPIVAHQRLGDLLDRDEAIRQWWDKEGPVLATRIAPTADQFAPVALQSLAACTNDTWTPTTVTGAPLARMEHAMLWTGSEAVVYGGGGFNGPGYRNGGFYDPATDSWRPLGNTNQNPVGGLGVTAVWTGTKIVVWGGSVNFGEGTSTWNAGSRYDPAANVWSATSQGTNVPSKRTDHAAVWTGTRMIVWGGVTYADFTNESVYLDDGGVYDPVSNSWTTMNHGHSCSGGTHPGQSCLTDDQCPGSCTGGANPGETCTADQDCVGGCHNNGSVTCADNTSCQSQGLGLCNNPAPGSCGGLGTCVSTYLPSARSRHNGFWIGNRMLVWGGTHGASNTGALFDPVADTWTPTSTGANVPSHSCIAVWTGTEMIAWGGDTGGRYNPATDTWGPMSLTNAPTSAASVAVWTGDEMITWGGTFGSNAGGRYRPSTDSWTPTSTGANVPTPRSGHAAVWTGDEMILWGGRTATSTYTNTGARYCATPACAVQNWYYDADGDGYGVTSVSVPACAQPAGYAATSGDCNDSNGGVHPGVAEQCGNGLDDDCDGIADDAGALAGSTTMSVTTAAGGTVSWTPLIGANGYDVVRGSLATLASSHGNFTLATSSCLGNDVTATSSHDASAPSAGQGYWYLVRGENCGGVGTYDDGTQSGSRDAEIQAAAAHCP